MKKLSLVAAGLVATLSFGTSANEMARENTSFQPGLNGGANAAKRSGDGLFVGVILNNYRANSTNHDGSMNPGNFNASMVFNAVSYNTQLEFLGAKYSYGAILPIGDINAMGHESKVLVGAPVLMPAQLYWQGDKLNTTARYYYRPGTTRGGIDKYYDTHQVMGAATYDINSEWQVNGAVAYEMRTKHLDKYTDVKPGNLASFEASIVRKFDTGVALGLMGYVLGNDTKDSGNGRIVVSDNKYETVNRHGGTVSAVGLELAAPISTSSAVSFRLFNEFSSRNSTTGTRAFIAYGKQF